jgi:hypothetical protein
MIDWNLLNEIADAIEAGDIHFDMEGYGGREVCRTYACVAGFAVAIRAPNAFAAYVRSQGIDILAEANKAFNAYGNEVAILDQLFHAYGTTLIEVNARRKHVPAALRWMASYQNADWPTAFAAVGAPL